MNTIKESMNRLEKPPEGSIKTVEHRDKQGRDERQGGAVDRVRNVTYV